MYVVDDTNNNRQGCLSFEEEFLPNEWSLRQFGHIALTFQANSMLGNSNFATSEEEKNSVKQIISEDWQNNLQKTMYGLQKRILWAKM